MLKLKSRDKYFYWALLSHLHPVPALFHISFFIVLTKLSTFYDYYNLILGT